jgi:hypothetical protein
MSETIGTSSGLPEVGPDDVKPALVQIDSETALVFGDATALGLDVEPLVFDFDASTTGERLALATGLTDHIWSYREYIWLPVHKDPVLTRQMEERIARLLTPALQGRPERCMSPRT